MVRHIKPVSPLAAVVGCLVFLAVYIASGDESLKEYLNVAIPMPETADFSPIIIDALPERTVFARINHLSLQEQPIPQRDAQVLAGTRSDWRFVGKNGEGISGADGSFLSDATKGPDGRLWVLLAYTRATNENRGNTTYLYSLQDDVWRLVCGPGLEEKVFSAFGGLHFVGSAEPLAHLRMRGEDGGLYIDVFYGLTDGKWKKVEMLSQSSPMPRIWVWRRSDGWCFEAGHSVGDEGEVISIRHLESWSSLSAPVGTIRVGAFEQLRLAAVSLDGATAMITFNRQTQEYSVQLAQLPSSTQPALQHQGRALKVPAGVPVACGWSIDGRLYLCSVSGCCRIDIHRLDGDDWNRIGHHVQDPARGTILDPKMIFRSDGKPLAVWYDFVPTD
jgi:hypothetical protein